ncbi:hypothetical protein U0C82_02750 [Fulvimarina sp. 2208YS6-2-32]|uniref:Uncharacterized protein n=1 Tax=Fulvimarina uroteuthidis TaxID=3098149 RepID=A0ABU5HY98_9HYPH|nr:hypothetical protein [Fulvimarina sp. 2208YS6-2-32]MDY8108067.1 hypothetical protein [Fulvimarina sp. 2208YS6-2-32]
MAGYKQPFIPGATNAPQRVREAISVTPDDHRAPDIGIATGPILTTGGRAFASREGRLFAAPSNGRDLGLEYKAFRQVLGGLDPRNSDHRCRPRATAGARRAGQDPQAA